jgi:hypothetical protein
MDITIGVLITDVTKLAQGENVQNTLCTSLYGPEFIATVGNVL